MVGSDNLEQSAVIGVTASLIVIETIMTIYIVITYQKKTKFKTAQKYLILLFFFPIAISWIAWVELLADESIKQIDFLMNLFKALTLSSFLKYVETLLGWIEKDNKNEFSSERLYENLRSDDINPRFLCKKFQQLNTIEKSKIFLKKVRICVYQAVITLIIIGIIGAISLFMINDPTTQNKIFFILQVGRSFSSAFAIAGLFIIGWYANILPEMFGLNIFHKLLVIKFGILFTEFQPLLIEIFAWTGLIANTSKYSVAQITIYTHSLLICIEMICMSFLIVILFPLSDFDEFPIKKSIKMMNLENNATRHET